MAKIREEWIQSWDEELVPDVRVARPSKRRTGNSCGSLSLGFFGEAKYMAPPSCASRRSHDAATSDLDLLIPLKFMPIRVWYGKMCPASEPRDQALGERLSWSVIGGEISPAELAARRCTKSACHDCGR